MRRGIIAFSVFLSSLGFSFPTDLAPHLSQSQVDQIRDVLSLNYMANREAGEKKYHHLVQRQVFNDLAMLYDEANRPYVKIVYASFTPDFQPYGGDDLGYGMHVVKRLTLPLGDGRTKVVEVNEAWPEERKTGGLLPPDEVRIKTLIFDGPRRVSGSHQLYLFDRIRLAWGPGNADLQILRQSHYSREGGQNHTLQARVPISAPYSCNMCHRPQSHLFQQFITGNEKRNYEAIVQDSQYDLPPSEQKGFREYLEHLRTKVKAPKEYIEAARRDLLQPFEATEVPGFRRELMKTGQGGSFNYLQEDSSAFYFGGYPLPRGAKWPILRQGYYLDPQGNILVDAIEDAFEGKYRWWEPTPLIPKGHYGY